MLYGDDTLLNIIKDQGSQLEALNNKICEMAQEIALLRAGQNAERCVICGAIIPEGRQVCPRCQSAVEEADIAWGP